MGVEFFKSKNKYGWRLRNAAGQIELSRAAVFPTQDAAKLNALADTRAQMSSLGIQEATVVVPPVTPPPPRMWLESISPGTVRMHWSDV